MDKYHNDQQKIFNSKKFIKIDEKYCKLFVHVLKYGPENGKLKVCF